MKHFPFIDFQIQKVRLPKMASRKKKQEKQLSTVFLYRRTIMKHFPFTGLEPRKLDYLKWLPEKKGNRLSTVFLYKWTILKHFPFIGLEIQKVRLPKMASRRISDLEGIPTNT